MGYEPKEDEDKNLAAIRGGLLLNSYRLGSVKAKEFAMKKFEDIKKDILPGADIIGSILQIAAMVTNDYDYFTSKFEDAKNEQESGIKIRSKESMHYFEIYNNMYGLPRNIHDDIISCPYCHFNTENSKFCRMCGAFPI